MLRFNLPAICVLYGIAIGLLIFCLGSIPRKSRLRHSQDEWLTEHFFQKLYVGIFGNTDPVKVCKLFGLEYDRYMVDCQVIDRKPAFEREAMMRVIGVFVFVFSIPIAVIFYSPVSFIFGCATYLLLCSSVVHSVRSKAQKKKMQLAAEMPRYVDLLLSALEIDLPIETAIIQTAENVPCILSDELKTTFAETAIGAKNWQQALEAIAHKYEIDQLSDFVLNIITAYNKGISITDTVAREAYAVRQSSLLAAKERASKMTTTVLFPLLIFKILPLLTMMLIPIFIQAMSFYGS